MPMKLLPKSDIAKLKAEAQKQAVDEGVKLAKRVDNLREIASQEEASLKKFRSETLAKIAHETKEASQKRDDLLGEVLQLEKRRKEALRPLDKEWEAINKQYAIIEEKSEDNRVKALSLQETERKIKGAIKQASDFLLRASNAEVRTKELLATAASNERETKLALQNARKIEKDAQDLSESMRKELINRDKAMASRERNCTMKEANLKERESALVKEWALLEDRKATFERRIKRANK